jgi:hypothetical protein
MTDDTVGYVVLYQDQWERVREIARKDRRYNTYAEKLTDRIMVVSKETDLLVADLGSVPEDNYYWMAFSILGDGFYLLQRAISVDGKSKVH